MTYFHDIVSNAEILSTLISLVPGVLLHKSNQNFSIILVFNAESVLREKKKRPSTTIPTTPPPPPHHPTYLLADALGLEYVSALKRKVIKMQDLLVLETTERFEIRFTSNTSLKATQGNE